MNLNPNNLSFKKNYYLIWYETLLNMIKFKDQTMFVTHDAMQMGDT